MRTLSVKDLQFSYDGNIVFEGVNLEFGKGEMIGLIGPNGAGKSTLLRLLMGLMAPGQGEVHLNGGCISRIKRRELAQYLTLVPQDSQVGYAFSAEELVAMGRNPWLGRFQPLGRHDVDIIQSAMEKMDVARFAKRSVNQLSGGERQRVFIARAIAQETPIIMLDEATANLDICHQLEILSLAKKLAEGGRTVIAAIHDLTMASRFCDRLLLLADKGLRADGRANEVLTEGNLRRYFKLHAEVHAQSGRPGLNIAAISPVSSSESNNYND